VRRKAKIYAEIVGFASNCDGEEDLEAPREDGRGIASTAKIALEAAKLSSDNIDLVIAEGTSTVAGDLSELNGMHAIFGDRDPPMVAAKSLFGHMAASAGSGELIMG
jgi:3-oxoacyl-(acyl-carrier-protein) synthase